MDGLHTDSLIFSYWSVNEMRAAVLAASGNIKDTDLTVVTKTIPVS